MCVSVVVQLHSKSKTKECELGKKESLTHQSSSFINFQFCQPFSTWKTKGNSSGCLPMCQQVNLWTAMPNSCFPFGIFISCIVSTRYMSPLFFYCNCNHTFSLECIYPRFFFSKRKDHRVICFYELFPMSMRKIFFRKDFFFGVWYDR